MPKKHSSSGFTLVELLVVIVMLGALTSFLIIFINPLKQLDKAKDVKRVQDFKQIQSALDTYYNDNNCYPTSINFGGTLKATGSQIYMKTIPQDPDCSGGGSCYQYVTDTNSNCPQWNVLFAKVANKPANTVACALEQIPDCLPQNYSAAGYGYCAVSGKADCAVLKLLTIPTSGGSNTIPTATPVPSGVPTPTSTVPTPTTPPTPTPAVCVTSTSSFQTTAITPQTGVFEAQFDVTPNTNLTDADTGFSKIQAAAYTDMAVIVEFNNQGHITARNGGAYQAASTISYTAGSTYHFRLDIDVPNHKYSAYVTPPLGGELTIGTNYSFRTEQSAVTSLAYWDLIDSNGTHKVCSMALSSLSGPTSTPTPSPTPTPPAPTPTPAGSTGMYGDGINIDTKANLQAGWTNHARVAHRFRASAASTITSVRFQQRGGPVYSGGTGGTVRVSIQADSGGQPSGTILGTSGTITPGNSGAWTFYNPVTVSASVTAGNIYYVVFDNVDANPVANYFSINEVFIYGGTLVPRQPAFADSDYAVLYAEPTTWSVQSGYTADMDITYASGAHDGMAYIQNMIDKYAVISGTSQMAREHFTVSGGSRSVSQAYVRVRRTSGSDPLILSVKQGSTTIASVSVPASSIAQSSPGGDNGGSVWAGGSFSGITLTNGITYDLVLSTASTSQYTAAPIREGTDSGLSSYAFRDGSGQFTTNGSSYTDMYAFSPVDLQFYFK